MATLTCSQGHPNPLGQNFCGTCGEDLTLDDEPVHEPVGPPAGQPAGEPSGDVAEGPAPVVDNPVSRRMGWVLFALAAVFLAVAVIGFVVARRHTTANPAPVPANSVARDQKVVWYFPETTAETDLVNRVEQFCAANPAVASIQINLMDLDQGNMAPVLSTDYPCT